eukprot:scaffold199401_cov18-Prasinocladus_malaysianus.AAC.1
MRLAVTTCPAAKHSNSLDRDKPEEGRDAHHGRGKVLIRAARWRLTQLVWAGRSRGSRPQAHRCRCHWMGVLIGRVVPRPSIADEPCDPPAGQRHKGLGHDACISRSETVHN